MDTTRLRNTIRNLTKEESEDDYEDLDEEEQDKLISTLRAQDAARTELFKKSFLSLTVILILPYFLHLTLSPTSKTLLLFLLATTSLLSTAYTLAYLPPEKPDPKGKRPIYTTVDNGPVKRYLGWCNVGVCVVLALWGWRTEGVEKVYCFVPGAMLGSLTWSRRVMGSVNVDELEGLRYTYKGA